ncbi:hypothetical protein CTI12_AA079500 [Artemisia annua]|uniref:Uncharacterized protein n=1 Tax=Artemisia annua TaxID=35608 RepID=A0A2U1NU35_ARTAN|nr:hypothetical protein CTI12_AA079500 [Artemisia annua]
MFDLDELLGVMDQKGECNNENKSEFSQIESVYVPQDPYGVLPEFGFDYVEGGRPEECSFSLEELGLTWEPTEIVLLAWLGQRETVVPNRADSVPLL